MDIKALTARQFDDDSRGWTERVYEDPEAQMRRRAFFILNWGAPLLPGDRVLELGCGDGALSCFLARLGLRVTGLDISPGMVDEARRRAVREGMDAEFHVGDVDDLEIEGPFDAAVSFMSAFFLYVDEPRRVLKKLLPLVRKKVILDWNHRSGCTPTGAARMIEEAGFVQVEWRPWFLPATTMGGPQLRFRRWLEEQPHLSLLPLILRRWRYGIYLKGEKAEARRPAESGSSATIFANKLPGTLAQRLLLKYGLITRGQRRRA